VRWLRRRPGRRSARAARSSATKTARGHHRPLARPSRAGRSPRRGPSGAGTSGCCGPLGSVAASFGLLCAQLTAGLARFGGYADRYSSALGQVDQGHRAWIDALTGTPVTSCGSSSTRICSPPSGYPGAPAP